MQITRLNTLEEVEELIRWHNEHSEYVVLDTETTGLDSFTDSLLLIVISGKLPDSAVVFPASFVKALSDLTTALVCHNFRFDYNFIFRSGVDLRKNKVRDTMLMHHLLDENKSHALDSIVKEWYGTDYKEKFWSKYKSFEEAPQTEQDAYAGADVIYTKKVFEDCSRLLESDGIRKGLIDHVHELACSAYRTEIEGVALDIPYTIEQGFTLRVGIEKLKEQMLKAAPIEIDAVVTALYVIELEKRKTDKGKQAVKKAAFNFDSSKQLQELLYAKLALPVQLSQDKRPTCDDAALERLADMHPLCSLLRDYRGKQKVYTAFIEGNLEKMRDARIYPQFNINGTVTGRISSSNPNMQQLPRSGGVRGIFIPDRGHSFISCDYKQLEVTLAAHFSLDKNLLRVVKEGVSLHDITADSLKIDRNLAKGVNFAMQYGAGAHKISKLLGCGIKRAEQAVDLYWKTYSELKSTIDELHHLVEAGKPIVSPFGRKRRFPKEFADKWELERCKRQAFNSLVQGTGADLTNRAFYIIDRRLRQLGYGKGLFVVHDEVIVSCKTRWVDRVREIVQTEMVRVGKEIELKVPLSVDCSDGMDRWKD